MPRADFLLSAGASIATVLLLAWQSYRGSEADWVYGIVAMGWSVLMLARLTFLTGPDTLPVSSPNLAQKIITAFRQKLDKRRDLTLRSSLDKSYIGFVLSAFVFAGWQLFCATRPAQHSNIESARTLIDAAWGPASWAALGLFQWGHDFMLVMAMVMMGFVLRSHADDRHAIRASVIILAGYAAAGLIFFTGLSGGPTRQPLEISLVGSGAGSWPFLSGRGGVASALFDILIVEGGVIGIALASLGAFVPLGRIALFYSDARCDRLVAICGMISGLCLILSVFLPFGPALGAYMILCSAGVFLAWGSAGMSDALRTSAAQA